MSRPPGRPSWHGANRKTMSEGNGHSKGICSPRMGEMRRRKGKPRLCIMLAGQVKVNFAVLPLPARRWSLERCLVG
ncbi:MAG: hypothetical protein ACP5XB_09365, partial [Isosphaeraceae bacterium]